MAMTRRSSSPMRYPFSIDPRREFPWMTSLFPELGNVSFGGKLRVTRNLLIFGARRTAQNWAIKASASPDANPSGGSPWTGQQPRHRLPGRTAGIHWGAWSNQGLTDAYSVGTESRWRA